MGYWRWLLRDMMRSARKVGLGLTLLFAGGFVFAVINFVVMTCPPISIEDLRAWM